MFPILLLISESGLLHNTNLLRENKDKRSLFFYAVPRGDFLFTVRKIINPSFRLKIKNHRKDT